MCLGRRRRTLCTRDWGTQSPPSGTCSTGYRSRRRTSLHFRWPGDAFRLYYRARWLSSAHAAQRPIMGKVVEPPWWGSCCVFVQMHKCGVYVLLGFIYIYIYCFRYRIWCFDAVYTFYCGFIATYLDTAYGVNIHKCGVYVLLGFIKHNLDTVALFYANCLCNKF